MLDCIQYRSRGQWYVELRWNGKLDHHGLYFDYFDRRYIVTKSDYLGRMYGKFLGYFPLGMIRQIERESVGYDVDFEYL
jgi:hypothetical protein